MFYELIVGTWGGTPTWDGNDGLTNPASLAANIPVEVAESEFPIVVERYGLVPNTGGAGEHRGGLAIERVWRCLTPATSLSCAPTARSGRPTGSAAASTEPARATSSSGRTGRRRRCRPCSRSRSRPATSTSTARRAAVAGETRSPASRMRSPQDVANEKVSVDAARERYGVVDRADGTVDAAATAALRDERRGA